MRLLLVEDDALIGDGLQQGLRREGYVVDWVTSCNSAMTAVQLAPYGFLLLDLGLPDQDGIELLRWLRQRDTAVSVIVITARDALKDRLKGLDTGADDYLVKPFAIEELVSRMRAVARRQTAPMSRELRIGPLRLDPARHLLWLRDVPVTVAAKDLALLELLMARPGVILSRAQIEDRMYGWGDEIGSNAVEVRIHHLRKKLGADVIQNVRGVGYRIREDA